jgi:hypothetical protein
MAPQRDPDLFFSHRKERFLIGGTHEVSGHSVHTTAQADHVAHGVLRPIGYVFRSGAHQRGRWIAYRALTDAPSEPFRTRLLAARWLLGQEKAQSGGGLN